jgi:endonuclease IV
MDAFFFHGVYLINLASADETLVNRSVSSLNNTCASARRPGRAAIFHVSSHQGAG